MPNPFLPRELVHEWSEEIGAQGPEHRTALNRVLKDQRRLTRFLEENREDLEPATAGVTVYLFGVLARIYDLAGGRLKSATWQQVREAARRVRAVAPELLPADEGFPERVRAIEWRAQPHILDEALMSLFERETTQEQEVDLDPNESAKVFLLMWVANEVLDQNWTPPHSFQGETSYSHVPIQPTEEA